MSAARVLHAFVFAAIVGCASTPPETSVPPPPESTSPVVDLSASLPPLTPSAPRVVTLDGDVRVEVTAGIVSFPGTIALDDGWLEVGVCRLGTREHEAIVVTGSPPSIVHAGLLLAGFESGRPGGYHENGAAFGPEGDRVEVELQPVDDDGLELGPPIPFVAAVLDTRTPDEMPLLGWVFAGSAVLPNPPSMGPGEYYAADFGGSVVGLSTFGDEVLAAIEMRSPDSGVDEAVWKIRPGVLPPAGSRVRVVIRRPTPPR